MSTRHAIAVFVAGVSVSLAVVLPAGAQPPFTSAPPVAITSCGQSPDAYTVSLLSKRVRLEHSFDNMLKPEALKAVKTLVVVMGGSAKGLGEAGIDEKGELARVGQLLTKARELGVKVLAVHVGGQSRRGALSDKFIDPVVAKADFVLVTEDGNKDGAFTKATTARKIPLVVVKQVADIGPGLRAVVR
ncbi:MAG TPA: DUF6305 family protein [Vicinamibacterales bacterium]|jgi:hypothetical protein